MATEEIPLLDLYTDNEDELAEHVISACKSYGFIQFINHKIDQNIVKEAMATWKEFYELPSYIKDKYCKGKSLDPWGFNRERNADIKECFNIVLDNERQLPHEVANIENISKKLDNAMYDVTIRILKLLARGLHLEEDFFSKTHSAYPAVYPKKISTLRSLYYPALQSLDDAKNAIRCGEHSDYGSISIIIQDMTGGLQLLCKDGEYKDVVPVENAIVVNIGDMMQRWTGDRLISTKHRVVFPSNSNIIPRISLAYFATPDGNSIIETTLSSDPEEKITLYESITSLEYLEQKFNDNYI